MSGLKITETIYAYGHRNISAIHNTTIEITKENHISKRGDCIIAVGATKGASDLSQAFKKAAKRKGVPIEITIESGGIKEVVLAEGESLLSFNHPTDLVIRKSNYICNRTIAVRSDKASVDLSRRLIRRLRDSNQRISIVLAIHCSSSSTTILH